MPQSLENAFREALGEIGALLSEKAGADVTVSMTVDEARSVEELVPVLTGAMQLPFSLGEATEHNAVLLTPQLTAFVLAAEDPSSLPDELTDDSKAVVGELASKIAEQVATASGAASPQVGEPDFGAAELGAGLSAAEKVAEFGFATQGGLEIQFWVLGSPEIAGQAGEAGETAAGEAEPADAATVETQLQADEAEKAEFVPFDRSAAGAPAPSQSGIDLILDVPLEISVELGRVSMLIKDILSLAPGSIVELGRTAGEPVDLLVNGRLVAKGEVVVIEDNFGIRVTEIVSPADRIAQASDLAS